MSSRGHTQSSSRRDGFSSLNLKYLLLALLITVTSTEGLTATCAAALGLPNLQGLRLSDLELLTE